MNATIDELIAEFSGPAPDLTPEELEAIKRSNRATDEALAAAQREYDALTPAEKARVDREHAHMADKMQSSYFEPKGK